MKVACTVWTGENSAITSKSYLSVQSGFEEHYSRIYGYASKGERVFGDVHGTHFAGTSVVGAIDKKIKTMNF